MSDTTAIPEPDLVLSDPNTSAFRDFARFAELIDERRQLNQRLKAMEVEVERLTPRLMQYFESHNIRSISIEGVSIFLRRELWARPKIAGDRARVCQALQAAGLGHFVEPNYNAHTLSAWVRNIEDEHAEEIINEGKTVADFLPPNVAQVLNVEPDWKLQGRKTAS
jgi:hypothetical protein